MNKNILEICQTLHQFNMGSLHEPHISDAEYREQYHYLRLKLGQWTDSLSRSFVYDNAVRNLILMTLHECQQTNHSTLVNTHDVEAT